MTISGAAESADHPVGLRERKKRRTRAAIVEAAMGLFVADGFERVTVGQIARRAEVSEATVFNYFRTKEDLVYSGLEDFWSRVLSAVRGRAAAESVPSAFGRFLSSQPAPAETEEARVRLAAVTRMVIASPTLRARELQAYDEGALALAAVIAGSDDPGTEDLVTAYALVGVHRVVVDVTRRRVLAGAYGSVLARRIAAETANALAVVGAIPPPGR